MKLLEQIKTLSVFPHGMIDISHVCLIFDDHMHFVDATIGDR